MRRSSCQLAVKKDMLRYQPTAFTLQVLNSGLEMAEGHAMEEECIGRALARPPLYNIVREGRPTKSRRMWAVLCCERQTTRETGTAGLWKSVTQHLHLALPK